MIVLCQYRAWAASAPNEASEQGSASVDSINIWGAAQVDEICFVLSDVYRIIPRHTAAFHFPVPSNIRLDPSPHMFDVVLIDYEIYGVTTVDSGGEQLQRQQAQRDLPATHHPITAQTEASKPAQAV